MSYPPPYGAPPGYGGYPPGYAAAPMMGVPVAAPVVMGAPVAAYGGMVPPPPPPGFVVPAYTPGLYSYQQPYLRAQPFIIPYGLPPHLAAKMMQASNAFRMFDTNWSGSLSKKEWKRALRYLGYFIPKGYGKWLFYTVDRDRSGHISEREFCEWWLATQPY